MLFLDMLKESFIAWKIRESIVSFLILDTLEPHYNTHFGVHSDISVITEQPYNDGLIHRKYTYKQWEPCL